VDKDEKKMLRIKWIYLLLALTSTSLWAGPTDIPAQPSQSATKNSQTNPDKETQLSEKDQILACPARIEAYPDAEGTYKVGGSVKPPRPTNQVTASFSDEARKMAKKMHIKSFQAVSTITLIVDSQGNPQSVCVQKPAGYGLDGQAVKAVKQYRFEPATKDGAPVPVRIFVEVNFRLY
jgi:TonB family protein